MITECSGTTFPELYHSPDETVQMAHDQIADGEAPTPRTERQQRAAGSLAVIKADPLAWAAAQEIIKSEGRGFPYPQPDGSVIIHYSDPRK